MLNAIVLYHYDFTNKNGQAIKTTKLRISLGEFGYLELCTDKANDFPVLSPLKVKVDYDNKYHKYSIVEVSK